MTADQPFTDDPTYPQRSDHVIVDLSRAKVDGWWWWWACACDESGGPFPDQETAVDSYGDHLWTEASRDR